MTGSGRGSALPSPGRRLLRDRAKATAVALLAVTLLASAGVSTGGTARLQSTLDENWRGLYDLLVTAPDTAASVSELLSPTAITSLSRRMSIEDVDAVRAVEGIEVAAPIGAAVLSVASPSRMRFAVPLDLENTTTANPVAYRATLTFVTDDGLGERIASRRVLSMVVDDVNLPERTVLPASDFPPDAMCNLNGVDTPVAEAEPCRTVNRNAVQVQVPAQGGWYSSFDIVEDHLVFAFDEEPLAVPHVVLVDPTAEQRLLGEDGAFLAPLVGAEGITTVEDLGDWAATAPQDDYAADVAAVAARLDREWAESLQDPAYQEYLEQLAEAGESEPVAQAVPFLVASNREVPLSVEIEVETGFGEVTESSEHGWTSWELPPGMDSATGTPVGAVTYDAAELLTPMSDAPMVLAWPGATPPAAELSPRTFLPAIVGSATTGDLPFQEGPTGPDGVAGAGDPTGPDGVRILAERYMDGAPRSDRGPGELFPQEADGTIPGREAMYRTLASTQRLPEGTAWPHAVVVGGFDTDAVVPDQTSLGYVPVGGIDPVGSTLVADATGASIDPVELVPSLSGFGLANATTTAVADIARSSSWGMREPVSAIRVRVADVEDYGPRAQAQVERVGQAIADLGYTVTMAAGSSRQDVRLEVDGYAFGTIEADGVQTVGPLGAIDQRWPRLGAAVTVEGAVTAATAAVLWLAVLSATLLLGAVQLTGVPGRRRDAAVLRTLGWRRRDVLRWFGAQEVAGVTVVLVVALAAVALASTQRLGGADRMAMAAVAAGVGAVLVTSAIGVVSGSRPAVQRAGRMGRPRRAGARAGVAIRSATGFGLGQIIRHRGYAATVAAAAAVGGWACAGLVSVVRSGVAAAGRTDLGLVAAAQGMVSQAVLGAVGLGGGVLLLHLAQRTDQAVRAAQWSTLRAIGWTSAAITRARVTELLGVMVPAVLLASAGTWLASGSLGPADPALLVAVTAGTGGLMTAVLLLGARRKVTA